MQMSEQLPPTALKPAYKQTEPLRKSNENLATAGLRPTYRQTEQIASAGLKAVDNKPAEHYGTAGLRPVPRANEPAKRSNEHISMVALKPVSRPEPAGPPALPQRQSLQPPPRPSQTQPPNLPSRADLAPPQRNPREVSNTATSSIYSTDSNSNRLSKGPPPITPRKSPPSTHNVGNSFSRPISMNRTIMDGRFAFPADVPVPRQFPSGNPQSTTSNANNSARGSVRLRDAPPPPPPSRASVK